MYMILTSRVFLALVGSVFCMRNDPRNYQGHCSIAVLHPFVRQSGKRWRSFDICMVLSCVDFFCFGCMSASHLSDSTVDRRRVVRSVFTATSCFRTARAALQTVTAGSQ